MAQLRFTRLATRALLVAGFAGGAWLMSSATAHAAAPAQTPTVGTDRGVVSLAAPVTRTAVDLLGAVLAPAQEDQPAGHHATRAASLAAARHRPAPILVDLLRPLVGAARPGTGTLAGLLAPVTDSLRSTLAPATGHRVRIVRTAAPEAASAPVVRSEAKVATRTPVRHPAATARPTVRATGSTFDTGTRQVPVLPDRTPVPAYPGSGNTGVSTTASGSHLDGGAFAAGSPVPGGLRAGRGLDVTEVPVRLLLAEAPIFAPD